MIDEIDVIEDEIEEAPATPFGYHTLLMRQIRRDGGTQARIGLNEDTVQDYAELMREHRWDFRSMQRPIVLYDGESYWLADGFHRVEAAQRAGLSDYPVEVLNGTQRDAILRAAGANSQHGLRRTNQDKRRAVELLLKDDEWRQWSDRKIADVCAVSNKFVGDVRRDLGVNDTHLTTRQGTDGKSYPVTPPAPKPATCIRCGAERSERRHLTSYQEGLVPEYGGKSVTLCSTCIPELMRLRKAAEQAAAPLPDDPDTQHMETIKAILIEAEGKGERTGTRLYQQAYDHAREIHDVALYNKAIALIDHATDTPPPADAHPNRMTCPTCGEVILNGIWGELNECGSCYHARQRTPAAPAQTAETNDDAASDRAAHLAKEARDRERLNQARNSLDKGNYVAAAAVLETIEVSTYERDQVRRTLVRTEATRFYADQVERRTRFSPQAMISLPTWDKAMALFGALLEATE